MIQETKKEEENVLDSIKMSRVILPILLGLGVVVWMMWRQLDWEEFKTIQWTSKTTFWLLMAGLMYLIRHVFYAWRLRVMTSEEFTWGKSMQLIVIWEFASAVSPTSIGGSAVALFLLAQEKISGAKTISVVLYSMVIDTIFFIVSLPLLFFLVGPIIVRPGMLTMGDLNGFAYTFIAVILFMASYGALFAYGLFWRPDHLKKILLWFSRLRFLKRFREDLEKTANDVVITSKEISSKPASFHIYSSIATWGAWITRFLALNCIIIALISSIPLDFYNQLLIYARGEAMHAITAFSPTPGGAGIAEYLFGGFFADYIPKGIATVIALIWRIITYYPYLVLGAIVIPVWLRSIVNRKRTTTL